MHHFWVTLFSSLEAECCFLYPKLSSMTFIALSWHCDAVSGKLLLKGLGKLTQCTSPTRSVRSCQHQLTQFPKSCTFTGFLKLFLPDSHQIYSFHFYLHFSGLMNISEQLSLFFSFFSNFQFPRLRATRSQRRWRRSALQKMAPTSSPPEIGKCRFF